MSGISTNTKASYGNTRHSVKLFRINTKASYTEEVIVNIRISIQKQALYVYIMDKGWINSSINTKASYLEFMLWGDEWKQTSPWIQKQVILMLLL